MIAPIDDANRDQAVELLNKGFCGPSTAFWADALDRITRFGGNAAAGLPLGHLMFADDAPVGVALTIASLRAAPEGARTYVNFAAWYVEPQYRWRAPLMLRTLARLPCDVMTDLTPSDATTALLPTFGFEKITQGVALNLCAFHRGGGEVRALTEDDASSLPDGVAALLLAHAPYRNIPALLRCRDGATVGLLFRTQRWRGLQMARVLYCGSNQRLFAHLGAVSAFLRAHGVALIKLEAPVGMELPPGWVRLGREMKFAKGAVSPDVTDYAGSELALLDFENRNVPEGTA